MEPKTTIPIIAAGTSDYWIILFVYLDVLDIGDAAGRSLPTWLKHAVKAKNSCICSFSLNLDEQGSSIPPIFVGFSTQSQPELLINVCLPYE